MTVLAPATLLLVLAAPLALAALLAFRATRPAALVLAPWAALPAFLVALAGWPMESLVLDWLLLGAAFGLDEMRRIFLLLTAAVWLAAGLAAVAYHRDDPKRARLFAFHLVTLAGNLGLVLARDAPSFYLFFITMSFAAFGLIVHTGTPEARRAGVVYLVLVIVGETLLLPGLWMAVGGAASLSLADVAANVADQGGLAMLLLAAGLGVKVGVLPLHVWLPLAHPVAPTPASAVLSGAMIKAGVLGWIAFLPLGVGGHPGYAMLFIVAGVSAAFYGAAIGVVQRKAKTVLAYSSISQMGFMTAAIGIGLSRPEAWPAAAVAVAFYALHHALAKGALFLGVAVVENAASRRARRGALVLLLLPGLALAGAPLTSGLIAKTMLKDAAGLLPAGWYGALDPLLTLAAAGTTVLIARFLYLLARAESHAGIPGLWPSWIGLVAASAVLGVAPFLAGIPVAAAAVGIAGWWSGLWPLALGVAATAGVLWIMRQRTAHGRPPLTAPSIREGDILWPLVRAGDALRRALPLPFGGVADRVHALAARRHRLRAAAAAWVARGEHALARWPGVGSGVVIGMLVIFLMLFRL